MMTKYNYIVSGNLTCTVESETEEQADEKLQEYLEENSPLRDWETYSEGKENESNKFDSVDIEVKA